MFSMHGNMHFICLLFFIIIRFSLGAPERGSCDPLVPEYCILPFPNSFYTGEWFGTGTGLKVNISDHTPPRDSLGRLLDTTSWNLFDGYSLFPSIITYFPDLSDSSNLPPHWDISRSLSLDSPTLIYNINTGALIPHFAELDVSVKSSGIPQQSLMLWSSQSLNESTSYVVILRYLRTKNGSLVEPSPAFKSLRDTVLTNDTDIEYRKTYFEELFELLHSKYGIKRQEIQLMWDFPTASKNCLTKKLLYMRDDAMKRIYSVIHPPKLEIVNVTNDYSEHIYRFIAAETTVPDYLSSSLPGSHLVTDTNDIPIYQRDSVLSFLIIIPHSVANGSISDPVLIQYGHGLFGDKTEVLTDYLQKQANTYGYIFFACTLWGMANYDVPSLVLELLLDDFSNIRILPDQLSQGVVNELVLMRLMKGAFSHHPLLAINGRRLIDPSNVHYYGVSLGGIMGEVYMGLTNDVERGVLGVSGGSFGLILPRSIDFMQDSLNSFFFIRGLYPDPVDFTIMISLLNMIWSRAEPSSFMKHITSDTLPNTNEHKILYQYALGDAQVNILGLYTIARSANAKMFASNVKEKFFPYPNSDVIVTEKLFGFQFISDETVLANDTAAVGFDCGAPPEPVGNTPPNANTDTHEKPRRAKLAQEQFDQFIRKGNIINTCNGPCTDCTEPP